MPVNLYGIEASPPCRAVLATAKAIGVDLQLKSVDLGNQGTKTDAFMMMNPNHTIPTMDDNGFYLWESRPIMAYLVDKYAKDDKLYPKEVKSRALVDQMLHFDLGSLNAKIIQYYYPQLFAGQAASPEKEADMRDKLAALDKIVAKNPFAAGKSVTIADISIVTSLTLLLMFDFPLDKYPNVVKYVDSFKNTFPIYDQVCKSGEQQLEQFVKSKSQK